jgi:predicted nucleotidyltransferase
MNISELLSTKERVKILEFILYQRGFLSVSRVAHDLRVSKGLVSKFLNMLRKEKILIKTKNQFLVADHLNTKTVKILLNLNRFDPIIFRKYEFVCGAGLYGSFVTGENTEESDIDLWIIMEDTRDENIAKLTTELKKTYRNMKPLYLTKEKLQILKKEDATFYHSLVFGSITVYGEKIETI